MSKFILTWVGECSSWECDDLGHLNVRFYMTKTAQARQMLIIKLGLSSAFGSDSVSSIRVKDFHIKYLGEARPGDPLRIESGILNFNKNTARLCHVMYHYDGRIAATIVETVAHVSHLTGKSFPWPKRARSAAKAFRVKAPEPSKPRGLSYDTRSLGLSEKRLKKLGLKPVGLGVFQPHEVGVQGHVTTQALIGRITETAASIDSGWPELHDKAARKDGFSGALLEARGFLHKRAAIGDGYHMYSGVVQINQYTRTLVHNLVDAQSGKNLFAMQAIGCLFNLNTRKLVKATPEQIARIEAEITQNLGI